MPSGDPWNLMASFYPRTRILHLDGMQWYQDALAQGGDAIQVSARFQRRIAAEVIELLDEARGDAPCMPIMENGQAGAEGAYRWALRLAGGSLAQLISGDASMADASMADASMDDAVHRIVSGKCAKGLL